MDTMLKYTKMCKNCGTECTLIQQNESGNLFSLLCRKCKQFEYNASVIPDYIPEAQYRKYLEKLGNKIQMYNEV